MAENDVDDRSNNNNNSRNFNKSYIHHCGRYDYKNIDKYHNEFNINHRIKHESIIANNDGRMDNDAANKFIVNVNQ